MMKVNINEIYSQSNQGQSQQKSVGVMIPKGAANPEVDITNLAPRQWYIPEEFIIIEGDTVTWVNNDTEPHTVTSGAGAGIESLLTNELGRADGIFDSGLFKPEESWSYNFTNPGRYAYFCTIHPWMEGIVVVKQQQQKIEIPSYPVDSTGNRLARFPVHTLTNDEKYDIDLAWDPNVIVTGEPISFIIDFFDIPTNTRLHLLPYDFIVMRNGTEIDRISDISEAGADVQKTVFVEPGPVTIKIENVGDTPAYTEFNTLVYANPEGSTEEVLSATDTGITREQPNVSRLISPLTLVYVTYAIMAGIPAAVAVIIILYRKGKI